MPLKGISQNILSKHDCITRISLYMTQALKKKRN